MINKIAQITSSILEDMNIFEIELKRVIEENDNFLKDYLCDFLFSNAKFLRPRLIFLFSKILKIKDEKVLKIAIIVELLHNASLIHDDIIDESKTRRNLKTFNEKYNSKIAVLEGDFLLALAMKLLVETDIKILEIFSSKILKTIQGEIKQNENIGKIIDLNSYFDKTFNKTANFFFAGLEALFSLKNDINYQTKNALKNYLLNFSYAFQIQNDIKDIEIDFACGNYTLPMIYFYMKNNKLNKDNIQSEIEKTKNVIEEYKQKAINSIEIIEENEYKTALKDLITNI